MGAHAHQGVILKDGKRLLSSTIDMKGKRFVYVVYFNCKRGQTNSSVKVLNKTPCLVSSVCFCR